MRSCSLLRSCSMCIRSLSSLSLSIRSRSRRCRSISSLSRAISRRSLSSRSRMVCRCCCLSRRSRVLFEHTQKVTHLILPQERRLEWKKKRKKSQGREAPKAFPCSYRRCSASLIFLWALILSNGTIPCLSLLSDLRSWLLMLCI